MIIADYINQEFIDLQNILANHSEFDLVEITTGHYQNTFKVPRKDLINIQFLIPSITNTATCKAHLFSTFIAQFKLNMCIKRNPNYELYYNLIEVLKLDSKYTDFLSSEISIETGRALITLSASKLATLRLI